MAFRVLILRGRFFFDQGVMLELALVNRACRLPALNAAQIFFDWQRQQKTVDRRIVETTHKIRKFPFGSPEMLDHEIPVTEAPMMEHHKPDRRMQMFEFGFRRRVDRNQVITAEDRAAIDAFGHCLSECRFPNPERAI
jgi:hypothetical protein